ncbi:hypothetical protein [Nonomuraea sp. NPDC003709]
MEIGSFIGPIGAANPNNVWHKEKASEAFIVFVSATQHEHLGMK